MGVQDVPRRAGRRVEQEADAGLLVVLLEAALVLWAEQQPHILGRVLAREDEAMERQARDSTVSSSYQARVWVWEGGGARCSPTVLRPAETERAHQGPSLRVGTGLGVVVAEGVEAARGRTGRAAHALVARPVLLLALPRVVGGLAAAAALLERLEEALTGFDAAVAHGGIARIGRTSVRALHELFHLADEAGAGGLQSIPLFGRADAHLAERGLHAVLPEPVLDGPCHVGLQGGPGPGRAGWGRRVQGRGVEGSQKVGDGGFGLFARRGQREDLSRSGLADIIRVRVEGQDDVA